jgi:prefoldin subunit 5
MSIEITDNTNFYKWMTGSNGVLNLAYQLGGNNNMKPILAFSNTGAITSAGTATVGPVFSSGNIVATGTISSAGLAKTSNSNDTNQALLSVDPNGNFIRDYATTNAVNNLAGQIQSINNFNIGISASIATVTWLISGVNVPPNLSNRLTTVETNVATAVSGYSAIISRLNTDEANISTLQAGFQPISAALATAQNTVTQAAQTVNGMQGQLNTLSGNYSGLSASYTQLSSAYNAVQTQLSTLQNQVNAVSPNTAANTLSSNSNLLNFVVIEGVLIVVLIILFITRKK